jgi:LmbE family N-acetylglucosaminyl deacetylase
MAPMSTIIAFHAHPDDEVLLTGGTLARLAAEGHRVVVVVACAGGLGEDSTGEIRLGELRASAKMLGVARVVHLGYADSGHGPVLFPDPPGQVRFARADLDEAAARLAALIGEEQADLLLSYDPAGGYGHRDHVKVHQVGARAAELAGHVRVLEATVPRELAAALFAPLLLFRLLTRRDVPNIQASFTPRAAITHCVVVRAFAAQKQAALAAHASQVAGKNTAGRLFRLLIMLPVPVFALLAGREWFVEPGARGVGALAGDILQPASGG